jgi:hypothetical protein
MPYHGAVLQFCVLGLLGVKTKSMMWIKGENENKGFTFDLF